MRLHFATAVLLSAAMPAAADPAMECDGSSQVEIGACVSEMRAGVDRALEAVLSIARTSAAELDEVTGREVALPALEQSQQAWEAWRDAECAYRGALFGGGSGTGIGIESCRIDLGRDRVDSLLAGLN
ncbi:lysozyme inhibitor LprI family protein [Halovulum sp. GXIMD14794]